MTEPFKTVAEASQLAEGQLLRTTVGEIDLVVANTGEGYFAFQALCTHQRCGLDEAELEGTTLECVCHGARFDVKSGEVLRGPAIAPLETYATRVEDGDLQVGT